MRLSELLAEDRILVPMEARDLQGAVGTLAGFLAAEGALDEAVAASLREALQGDDGDLVRINEAMLLAAIETPDVERLTGALGVSTLPFRVDARGKEGESTMARGLVLLVTPRRLSNLRVQAIPTITRFFQDPGRSRAILQASSAGDVAGIEAMGRIEIHDRLLVQDALTPLQYRVYPHTPMEEVVDLMIRRGLHAVPVVGENQEVLGILTAGDALEHLLPRTLRGNGEEQGPSVARDVMSRSVLCVSEDQPLVEAANTMLNKNVAQLPVVREGELIGFLTRETVLRQLFGR